MCLYRYWFCIVQLLLLKKKVKYSVWGIFIDLLNGLVEDAEAFEGNKCEFCVKSEGYTSLPMC